MFQDEINIKTADRATDLCCCDIQYTSGTDAQASCWTFQCLNKKKKKRSLNTSCFLLIFVLIHAGILTLKEQMKSNRYYNTISLEKNVYIRFKNNIF